YPAGSFGNPRGTTLMISRKCAEGAIAWRQMQHARAMPPTAIMRWDCVMFLTRSTVTRPPHTNCGDGPDDDEGENHAQGEVHGRALAILRLFPHRVETYESSRPRRRTA